MTTPTPKRFTYALFGQEATVLRSWNLFARKGNTKTQEAIKTFKGLPDLKKHLCIDFLGNGWTAAFMKDGYNIQFVPRLEQIPEMLAHGRGDIAIQSTQMMNWWNEKKDLSDQIEMHEVDWHFTRFHFVSMVSRKSPWSKKGLVRAIDIAIRKMKAEGVWHQILDKYKNPHHLGKPFKSHLDEAYAKKHGFYKDYDNYPIYKP